MMGKFRAAILMAALVTAMPFAAAQQGNGGLTSKVELEKATPGTNRNAELYSYVEPKVVVPGDRLRITLTFTNNGTAPATGLNITNPIPEGLYFNGTSDTTDFTVSVDGGKSFGPLASLMVPVENAAPRAATLSDVTHVRWLWSHPVAPQQSRSVAFFGLVK
jgi:uncharacterized repeat protein (TIGR01451 family)